jgi:hypothetical protein
MRLQEQGKTDQARKDLGKDIIFSWGSNVEYYVFEHGLKIIMDTSTNIIL